MNKLLFLIILTFLLAVPICTQVSFAQGIAQSIATSNNQAANTDTIHSHEHSTATEEYFDAVWRAPVMVGWTKNRGLIILTLFLAIGIIRLLRRPKVKKER